MIKETVKTPKLRFPGFTNDWEQRKLGEVTLITKGKQINKSELTKSGRYYVLNGGMVPSGYTDSFNTSAGTISISEGGNSCGFVALNTSNFWSGGHNYTLLQPTLDTDYLYQCLKGQEASIMALRVGSGLPNIQKQRLSDIIISFPNKYEQEMIGGCLCNLDNLITLYQRKLDDMKKYKKGMLQKMFPKEGETAPEIRFPGFTGDWEYHELGDLYTERNERGNDNLSILSVSIHSGVSNGELNENDLGKTVRRSEDKSTYKHVYSGDLVFNMMRAWQGAIGVVKTEGMVSSAYISAIPCNKIYPPFMNYNLRRDEIINQINNLSYGVTDFRKRLYWNSFVTVSCMLPSVEEQKAITDVLELIDSYITLQQLRVGFIKEYKKGLLQQMFV